MSLLRAWYRAAIEDTPTFTLSNIADQALYETKHNEEIQVVQVDA